MLKSEGLEPGFFPGHSSGRSAQPAFARTSTRFDSQFDSQVAAASWDRVRSRLKSTLGEEVYASWFACMQLDAVAGEGVRLSVPTRFLKSWIQTHYAEPLDAFWREEMPSLKQVDLVVRSAVARLPAARRRPSRERPAPERRARAICSTPPTVFSTGRSRSCRPFSPSATRWRVGNTWANGCFSSGAHCSTTSCRGRARAKAISSIS
ncbi:MAG: hypothetical protein HC897_05580 [Thermoanaerobaculia bacterium]|nr:hypothetical protein [Thermoanaerobaculia bacterium]